MCEFDQMSKEQIREAVIPRRVKSIKRDIEATDFGGLLNQLRDLEDLASRCHYTIPHLLDLIDVLSDESLPDRMLNNE